MFLMHEICFFPKTKNGLRNYVEDNLRFGDPNFPRLGWVINQETVPERCRRCGKLVDDPVHRPSSVGLFCEHEVLSYNMIPKYPAPVESMYPSGTQLLTVRFFGREEARDVESSFIPLFSRYGMWMIATIALVLVEEKGRRLFFRFRSWASRRSMQRAIDRFVDERGYY